MRAAELTAEQRADLADYNMLCAYNRLRTLGYGDMSRSRRWRELDRLADALIRDGVPLEADGQLPRSTRDELAAAFDRVARPRMRRLERETAPWTAADGTVYATRTRYNGTSLDTWRALERELGAGAEAQA